MKKCKLNFTKILGGTYALKYSAQSTKDSLHFGTVVAFIGIRYKNYCSNTVRTMMVNPTEQQTETYNAVLEAHEGKAEKIFFVNFSLFTLFLRFSNYFPNFPSKL